MTKLSTCTMVCQNGTCYQKQPPPPRTCRNHAEGSYLPQGVSVKGPAVSAALILYPDVSPVCDAVDRSHFPHILKQRSRPHFRYKIHQPACPQPSSLMVIVLWQLLFIHVRHGSGIFLMCENFGGRFHESFPKCVCVCFFFWGGG